MIQVRHNEKTIALILETDMVDPPSDVVDGVYNLEESFNVVKRSFVVVIFNLWLDHQLVLWFFETRSHYLHLKVSSPDCQQIWAGMKAQSNYWWGWNGIFRVMITSTHSPTLRFDVEETQSYCIARWSESKFLGAWGPFWYHDGQFDVDVDQLSLPHEFWSVGLSPNKDASVVTRGDEFIISWPVNIADCLRVIFDFLKQLPGVDVIILGYSEDIDDVVLLGGDGTKLGPSREAHSTDVILLEVESIRRRIFHLIDLLKQISHALISTHWMLISSFNCHMIYWMIKI